MVFSPPPPCLLQLPNDAESWVFVKYGTLFTELARRVSPALPHELRQDISTVDPLRCASAVFSLHFSIAHRRSRSIVVNELFLVAWCTG